MPQHFHHPHTFILWLITFIWIATYGAIHSRAPSSISPARVDWSCFCTRWQSTPGPTLLYFTAARFSGAVRGDKWFIFLSVHHSCSTLPELFPLITLYDLCGNIQFSNFGAFFNALPRGPEWIWYDINRRLQLHKTMNISFLMNNAALLWVSLTSAAPGFQMELHCIPQDSQCDY